MDTVLIVEDEATIRTIVQRNLEKRDFNVLEAEDGLIAIDLMQQDMPTLALIDLALPRLGGLELCSWIRERSDMPIIVISAEGDEKTKVKALDLGADDYVTKPFGIDELLARMRAVMRRMQMPQEEETRIEMNGMVVDIKARRAFVDDNEDLKLTRTEFALLTELARNADDILSHDELLTKVWGPEYRGSSHYLHVYLGRIRNKLGGYSRRLETISGMGYILHSKDPL